MSAYTPITAAGVSVAEPLDMDQRRRPAQDLTITVRCRVDSFDTEICFQGDIERLHAVVARLRTLGAEPVSRAAAAAAPATNGSKPKTGPEYNDAGDECCPHHHRKLRGPNQWGKLFCSAKDETGEYCKFTWKPE